MRCSTHGVSDTISTVLHGTYEVAICRTEGFENHTRQRLTTLMASLSFFYMQVSRLKRKTTIILVLHSCRTNQSGCSPVKSAGLLHVTSVRAASLHVQFRGNSCVQESKKIRMPIKNRDVGQCLVQDRIVQIASSERGLGSYTRELW